MNYILSRRPRLLECGDKRSATPLWLAWLAVLAKRKRRRRCALSILRSNATAEDGPARSKGSSCRLSSGLLSRTAGLVLALAARFCCASGAAAPESAAALDPQPGLMKSEFIFETAPFPSSHASTIVETKAGLLAAWFGGPHERHPQVVIWTARHDSHNWSKPVQVADGIQEDGKTRYPCWNPVLFQPQTGPLLLRSEEHTSELQSPYDLVCRLLLEKK